MSLHKYKINFHDLTPEEKDKLVSHLDEISWNGLAWSPDCKSAEFFVDEKDNFTHLKIPDSCCLTRLYQ